MTSLEFFVSGFLIGVISTLLLCAMARKRSRTEEPVAIKAPTEQLGSSVINAPDALAKIGRETGAEITDD